MSLLNFAEMRLNIAFIILGILIGLAIGVFISNIEQKYELILENGNKVEIMEVKKWK